VTSHATPSGATFRSTLPAALALSHLNAVWGRGVLANDCPPNTTGRCAEAASGRRREQNAYAHRDAAGGWHDVVVRRTPKAASRCSTSAPQITVVATLTGYDERRPEAEALARDYAAHEHPLAAPASRPLPPVRHRALRLGIMHANSDVLVYLAAGARRDGRPAVATRDRPDRSSLRAGRERGDDLLAVDALQSIEVTPRLVWPSWR
jgi:hypothetical protein